MDKSVKIILFVIIAILVVNFVVSFFGNSTISGIRKDLENAKLTADSALSELKFSKAKLDSIKSDMLTFRSYISSIQQTVRTNDNEKIKKEKIDNERSKDIKRSIEALKPVATANITLPEVDVITIVK